MVSSSVMHVKFRLVLLSLFSALLLSLSWYWHLSVFIFFAWVPLLLVEEEISRTVNLRRPKIKLFLYSYLTFIVWNVLVTWWVVYASFGGGIAAFVANSLLMSIVFLIYSSIKKRIQKPWAIWLLIPIWVAWEHGHTLWDLSWTWLTLGNVFAFNHNWIQWYEFTGTSGGTVWVLVCNILIVEVLRKNPGLKLVSKPIVKVALTILLPILFSFALVMIEKPLAQKSGGLATVVVQPNIDPYNAKFSLDYQSQFFKALDLIKGKITNDTKFLVLPETFITDNLNEADINQSEPIRWFRDSLLAKYPDLNIITGANTYVFYKTEKEATATARKDEQSGMYYDVYNTALEIDAFQTKIYHKSKLVPGVERMPFPALLKPLEGLAINMGGTMGSLGTQEERTVFTEHKTNSSIAPVVCYESVYADYVGGYVRNGANLIFIITNDGWWQDTPGFKQHLNYARLRAIENRRQIARCANTGISCFVDEFGNISDATNWWQEAVIEKKLYKNDSMTFFSRFGDLISYASVLISLGMILWLSIRRFKA